MRWPRGFSAMGPVDEKRHRFEGDFRHLAGGWLRRQCLRSATLARTAVLVYGPRSESVTRRQALAEAAPSKPINWTNASTLISVAILVGTELVGASVAAGWAIGGLFALGETISHILEIVFVVVALTGLYYFLRAALAHEPIRG